MPGVVCYRPLKIPTSPVQAGVDLANRSVAKRLGEFRDLAAG